MPNLDAAATRILVTGSRGVLGQAFQAMATDSIRTGSKVKL